MARGGSDAGVPPGVQQRCASLHGFMLPGEVTKLQPGSAAAGSVLSPALPVLRPLSDVNDSNIYPCTKPQDEISLLKCKTNLVVWSLYLPQSPSESLGELLSSSVKRG